MDLANLMEALVLYDAAVVELYVWYVPPEPRKYIYITGRALGSNVFC